MAELLPCPWCNKAVMSRKALWPSDGNVDSIIHAEPTNCGMAVFEDGTTDESILQKWNARAVQHAQGVKAYVVCQNDFPAAVFASQVEANEFISQQPTKSIGGQRIYWHSHVFALSGFLTPAATDDKFKLVYIKRWRTLFKIPASIADEVRDTLNAEQSELAQALGQVERLTARAEAVCGWDTASDHPDFSRDVRALWALLPSYDGPKCRSDEYCTAPQFCSKCPSKSHSSTVRTPEVMP